MATVEEIYRRIRRGDTAGLVPLQLSNNELEAGVDRIRNRLAGNASLESTPHTSLTFFVKPWVWAPAIAAMLVVGLIFWPKNQSAPQVVTEPAGTTWQFGSVAVTVLKTATLTKSSSGAALHVDLTAGMLAVKRANASTALTINTPEGKLTAQGTVFVVEHAAVTAVQLFEGQLEWVSSAGRHIINPNNSKLGRDMAADIAALAPTMLPQKNMRGATTLSAFRKNDCVIYAANGNRREGKIREVVHGEYRVERDGIIEPDLFRDSDLVGCAGRKKS